MVKGDIILVRFPFTDLSGSKLRPALVLLESGDDVVVAFITTVLAERCTGDIQLKKTAENGLKKDSTLRLTKLSTLSKDLIAGWIGNVSREDLVSVNRALMEIFQIEK